MRSKDEIIALFDKYVVPNYTRNPVVFTHAENCHIWDTEGKRYIDFFPGWATTSVGHCHPRVVRAVQAQVSKLIHVDNTFYTEPQGELARRIAERGFGGQSFFCNSGAEANEAAIKLARVHLRDEGRFKIITMRESFHGRTLNTITATGQDKYHEGIGPLAPGFEYAPFGDLDAVEELLDDETAAVLLEPIQGEGGINVPPAGFLEGLRRLCDREGLLLILDEVQTAMGRTGKWFGYQNHDITPDIITLAKALGGGVAIGAMCAKPDIAASLKPGLHAATFGGNPLACAAAIAVFQAIEEEDLIGNCNRLSPGIFERLRALAEKRADLVKEVRGRGFMIGIELHKPGADIFKTCLERGLRINCTHNTVLRLMPPLTVTAELLDEGLAILEGVIAGA